MATAKPGAMAPRKVSIIDLWKALALVLILIDHIGLYLLPDENWLRIFGRASLPIWFLLIGFAGGRTVPWTWFVLGTSLIGLDIWQSGGLSGNLLNILFTFAAIRFALPFIEARIWPDPWLLTALVTLLALAAPLTNMVSEYGTEGVLLALVGVAHRFWLAASTPKNFIMRIGLATISSVALVTFEARDFGFDASETMALAFLVAAISIGLLFIRRGEFRGPISRPFSNALICLGRYSLWFYAGQIVLLMLLGEMLGITPAGDGDDNGAEF